MMGPRMLEFYRLLLDTNALAYLLGSYAWALDGIRVDIRHKYTGRTADYLRPYAATVRVVITRTVKEEMDRVLRRKFLGAHEAAGVVPTAWHSARDALYEEFTRAYGGTIQPDLYGRMADVDAVYETARAEYPDLVRRWYDNKIKSSQRPVMPPPLADRIILSTAAGIADMAGPGRHAAPLTFDSDLTYFADIIQERIGVPLVSLP